MQNYKNIKNYLTGKYKMIYINTVNYSKENQGGSLKWRETKV